MEDARFNETDMTTESKARWLLGFADPTDFDAVSDMLASIRFKVHPRRRGTDDYAALGGELAFERAGTIAAVLMKLKPRKYRGLWRHADFMDRP